MFGLLEGTVERGLGQTWHAKSVCLPFALSQAPPGATDRRTLTAHTSVALELLGDLQGHLATYLVQKRDLCPVPASSELGLWLCRGLLPLNPTNFRL